MKNTEFVVGDRVKVKAGKEHDNMVMDMSGSIVEISTPALAIKFDDMDEVHKWYVQAELEKSDDVAMAEKSGKKKPIVKSLVLGNETGTEENETRGRWNRDKELEIEGNIDELRLDGYSDADIQKKLPYSKELIVTKRELLEKRDKLVGEETDQAAKKRELDL